MKLAVALLLACSSALADSHTGAAVDTAVDHPPPSATLYLRCVGWKGGYDHRLIDAAMALVARVPGVTLDVALEPRDWNASSVAEALAAAPDTSARLLVLAGLIERGTPRVRPRARPHHVAGAEAFIHRPAGQLEPSEAYLSIGGHALTAPPTESELDAWAAWGPPETSAPVASTPRRYSGASGRLVVLRWHVPKDGCGALALLFPALTHGRVRVVFDVSTDPLAPLGVKVVGRAIARATPETQVALARMACTHALSTREAAVQVLVAVGVDPDVPGLYVEDPVGMAPPGGSTVTPGGSMLTVDGKPTSYLDVLSVGRPRSLRQRIVSPRR
ncbi:MAG: hypothetical protein ABI321_08495 [Polyangia bacterium]